MFSQTILCIINHDINNLLAIRSIFKISLYIKHINVAYEKKIKRIEMQ